MLVESDRRYTFPVSPAQLWSAFERVDDYRTWWPWLRRFEPGALEVGQRWACTVQPPLPYSVSFDLVLTEVVETRAVSATVEGDLSGTARLAITSVESGCELHLISALEPTQSVLRVVTRAARPVASFGHDWVLDTGFRQFSKHALTTDGPAQH